MDAISSASEKSRPRKRPGGRTADVTRRIHQAVLELLAEGGIDSCTFQAVAERAGVERSTLYRRNPDKWETIVDAIIDYANQETPYQDRGSFREDLRGTLQRLADILAGPLGPPIMTVAAALQGGHAPHETGRFWASRQKQIGQMFDAAIARGELPSEAEMDEIFPMAAGPLFFRAFVVGRGADQAFIDEVVDMVCDRYCLTPAASRA